MTEPTFDELLAACTTSAVHLETRDGYMLDDPAFIAWQDGHRLDPSDRESWWRPWLANIENAVARGVVMRRARIVSEPLSEYIRWEHEETFTNVAAGEDIRWLPRRNASALALPGNDFWLFDGTVVQFNHFSGNGDFLGQEVNTDPEVVTLCTRAFEAVWELAIPHAEYRPA